MKTFSRLEQFIRQQIDVFGDELALKKDVLNKLSAAGPPASVSDTSGTPPAEDWQDSPTLYHLEHRIHSCTRCPLGLKRNRFVFGNGNSNAHILLIGEAPGQEEDEQGDVFVGAAGQLLDKILKAIHLDRQSIYICNIVKCHPPGNRDPLASEIETCLPYLKKQIELVSAKFILTLGRIAAQTLLQSQEPLSHLRGKAHNVLGASLIATYHPAVLLRHTQYKRPTWEDVQLLRQLYDQWLNQT